MAATTVQKLLFFGHVSANCPANVKKNVAPPLTIFVQKQPPKLDPKQSEQSVQSMESHRSEPNSGLESARPEQSNKIPQLATGNSGSSGLNKGKDIVLHNSYSALAIMEAAETRVSQANVQRTRRNLLNNWAWFEDYSGPAGRIWLAWDSLEVGIDILEVGSQFIHCRAANKRLHTRCLITVIYGDYDIIPRRELWTALRNLSAGIQDEPWLILGDFNAVMDDSEVCGQAADTSASMAEFRSCVRDTGLVPLPFTGCPYTWHNCSDGPRSLWKRLDRMLVNGAWLDMWPGSSYVSALPSTSDHSPLILAGTNRVAENAVFRFDNYLAQLPGFLGSVENIWKHHIPGTVMYEIVCKLNLLKAEFRRQKRRTGELQTLIGRSSPLRTVDLGFLQHELRQITPAEASLLVATVTAAESMFEAVGEFFRTGKLLKQINTTLLALIPKVNMPTYVSDYRPISCCNVLYKAITKIIVKRIQRVLPLLINYSQNAFVPGRSISDNILLAQELLAGYNQTRLPERCTLKVDIQKAYDSVEWDFLLEVLTLFNFPTHFINLIEQCVSTASFSVSLNGAIHGFFKGGRGLRQGDPMSPYLFVLVMEVGSALLRYRVQNATQFQYHWKCKELGLLNLCFADDILLFCKADIPSVKVLTETLSEFATFSGLKVNPAKSQIIFSRAVQQQRQQLLDCVGFQEGSLPIKYLGIPLTSSRLTIADCRPLIDKVDTRLAGWNHQNLSYAGRIQLIKSVLSTLHTYWASVFF
ncbi:UNVERIFIED_CONTAM: hypothetical protein Sradi_7141400 [Sesamum radiatum]|uniref:Reverse transcriptase domain-containing protein n=1 Tax=Sesamum radiatum TaxID=300843 RepID=A0AAW2IYD7_SESRA